MSYAREWLELAVRWIHVIAGVAWIGTSFYFNWLNDRLAEPATPEEGIRGELWSVHGGAFYRVLKYQVAPDRLPPELHWFKWEAYLTWISGFALLVLVYYLGADVYLLDPAHAWLSPIAAVSVGIGTLLVGWWVYDGLCRSPLGRRQTALALVGLALLGALAFGLTRVFGSRGAYIHVGAMLGTIMAANVFRVIIPSQRDLVSAVEDGREPDAAVGAHAAMRSRHNNYLTLPVLFVMISNHYPITYGHRFNWLILVALFVIGSGTRHYFNLRNKGRPRGWILPAAALALLALAYAAAGTRSAGGVAVDVAGAAPIPFPEAQAVIVRRCLTCHSVAPAHKLFDAPPKGVAFDEPEQIRSRAAKILEMAVESTVMPLGNFTHMTPEERVLLGRWIRQGANIE